MKRQSDLLTLPAAIAWLESHLDELADVPLRLHDHAVGDKDAFGAPRFSGAFWHRLVGSAFSTHTTKTQVECWHPLMGRFHGEVPAYCPDCPECFGSNVKESIRDEYDRPLAAALVSLSKEPAPSVGTPSAAHLILALLVSGLDHLAAAARVGIPTVSPDHERTVEAMFLLAIRKLYSRFSSGPIGRPRAISDAQADAEAAA